MTNASAREIAETCGRGREIKTSATSWNTVCPAHADNGPSLTVTESGGRVLFKCHAGCSQDAVIAALIDHGLWEKKRPKTRGEWVVRDEVPDGKMPDPAITHSRLGTPSKRWEYRNFAGKIVGFVYRFDKPEGGKELAPLSWCHDNTSGQEMFRWKSFNKPRPLYNEHLLRGNTKPVLLVEGEKTADAAAELFPDLIVVSWPGGGNAVKLTNWEKLRGRHITIWPDADEPGFKTASIIAEILSTTDVEAIRLVDLPEDLQDIEKGWDLADEVPPSLNFDRQVLYHSAGEFKPSGDIEIDKMNKNYAFVIIGGKSAIIRFTWDNLAKRNTHDILAKQTLADYLANRTVTAGREQIPLFDYWMRHPKRLTYEKIVFEPGIETPRDFNLWTGFAVEEDPSGEWDLLKQHIFENIAQGDESLLNWVLAWFAQMLQEPRRLPGTSLTFKGKQGTGKTIVGQAIGRLIKNNYTLVDSPHQVTGNFNSHMAKTLLLQADEGFFGADPRIAGRLKSLVTSETNRIEYKGKDAIEIPNYLRLMVTSNERWVVPAALQERRFAVFDVAENNMQDRHYFGAVMQQLNNGGYGGLLYDLLRMDLSTIDVSIIPGTAALADQKTLSLNSVQSFWYDCLTEKCIMPTRSDWPSRVSKEELYTAYITRCRQVAERYPDTRASFDKELSELVGGDLKKTTVKYYTVNAAGYKDMRTGTGYKIPPIDSCRQRFESVIGNRVNWPVIDQDDQPEMMDECPF